MWARPYTSAVVDDDVAEPAVGLAVGLAVGPAVGLAVVAALAELAVHVVAAAVEPISLAANLEQASSSILKKGAVVGSSHKVEEAVSFQMPMVSLYLSALET